MGDEQQKQGLHNLTDEELEILRERLLESIYTDIGKSVVSKILWVFGAIGFAAFAWLTAHGFIKIGE